MLSKRPEIQNNRGQHLGDWLRRNGVFLDAFGLCLDTAYAQAYLRLRGAQGKAEAAGLVVCRGDVSLGLVAPIFASGVGWLYPLRDLERVLVPSAR